MEMMENKSSEANAVWQTRRKRKIPVEVVRRCERDFRGVGVKRWRTKAVDRNEWQRIIEEI
jgi:hypothetical protein